MATYVTLQGRIYVGACYCCPALYAMPDQVDDMRRIDHGTFYCSAGHAQAYKSETEREKKDRLERERLQGLISMETRLREESERAAADAEKEKLAAKREAATVKRTLRNQVKVAANAVAEKGELKEKVQRMKETRKGKSGARGKR